MKIRIKFAKEGAMKFIGHLDMMRYFQKMMRKADVDICYSGGFSPHQIMSFAAPLGVGLTSRGEYVDIEVASTDSSAAMMKRLNSVMVEGVEVLSYRRLPDNAANAMSIVAAADYTVCFREEYLPEDWDDFCAGIEKWLEQDKILVMKKTKKGEKELDIRPLIYHLSAEGQQIRMQIATGSAANLKPSLIIQTYMESRGMELAEFALMVRRDEVYADLGDENEHKFCPLDKLGEDIE